MWKLKEQNKTKAKQEKDLEAEEELYQTVGVWKRKGQEQKGRCYD